MPLDAAGTRFAHAKTMAWQCWLIHASTRAVNHLLHTPAYMFHRAITCWAIPKCPDCFEQVAQRNTDRLVGSLIGHATDNAHVILVYSKFSYDTLANKCIGSPEVSVANCSRMIIAISGTVPMEIRGEIFQILRGIPRITQWKSAALSAVIAIFCGKSTHFLRSIKAAFTWLQTEKACFRMRYIILVHNNIDMLNGVLTVYRYIMIQRNILLHMKRCT